jgi:hypothetical protein
VLLPRLEGVNPNEVLLYLGYRGGGVPEDQAQLIQRCIGDVLSASRPRLVYRVFPVSGGQLTGAALSLEGEDIRRHLDACPQAVLMAATLGPDVETLLMRAEVTDMARAVVLDSVASAAIENVCDNLEADLRREYEGQGLYLTDRFSPGYGDLPIRLQAPVCEVLDTRRRIGLSVSESGILLPRKSVTALMGVSEIPRPRRSSGCANCSLFHTCDRRKCRTAADSPL